MYTIYGRSDTGMHPWMMPLFLDPLMWLDDLEKALAGEAAAIEFYAYLESIAPNERARDQIHHAHQDEIKHYRMFSRLYMSLTGRQPVMENYAAERPGFAAGVYQAFNDELEATDLYRGMLLSTRDMAVRDIMFEAMTDEMEHADRFTMITAMDWTKNDKCIDLY